MIAAVSARLRVAVAPPGASSSCPPRSWRCSLCGPLAGGRCERRDGRPPRRSGSHSSSSPERRRDPGATRGCWPWSASDDCSARCCRSRGSRTFASCSPHCATFPSGMFRSGGGALIVAIGSFPALALPSAESSCPPARRCSGWQCADLSRRGSSLPRLSARRGLRLRDHSPGFVAPCLSARDARDRPVRPARHMRAIAASRTAVLIASCTRIGPGNGRFCGAT
jgi:hypothetical protein